MAPGTGQSDGTTHRIDRITEEQDFRDHNDNNQHHCTSISSFKGKICVIGSGNWGSVAAKLVAENALLYPHYHGMDLYLIIIGTFMICSLIKLPYMHAQIDIRYVHMYACMCF